MGDWLEQFDRFVSTSLFSIGDAPITAGRILLVPLVLIVGLLIIRMAGRIISNRLAARGTNPDLVHFLRRLFFILATILLGFTLLEILNVPLTAFAFVSGAVAIGLGFGAQNIINNFISGWILMWERPIRIGDFLEVGPDKGTVEAINTRSTRIRRVDGVHLLIPNSTLLETNVVNWTLIDRTTRTMIRVGVAYGSPVALVAELIGQAVKEREDVLTEPAPKVFFEDFGDSALIFDAYFWIRATVERDLREIRSNIRFRIAELFDQNGIVIAFPQRDVHLDGSLTIRQGILPEGDAR
ncbi:MAG: mechanosensitive ion channel [Xanthomonadales bacterium]|nr:mechanosensitive ion channel [Xanthomonadales bacterium]